ncbi:MAG: glutaminase A [Planctomycetota bacterium]
MASGRAEQAGYQALLEELHERYQGLSEGRVADYIPELAKAQPSWFGIALATVEGDLYQVGDYAQPFTLQSIGKPFSYGLALEDNGREEVLRRVGVEPTGDVFNSIIKLDLATKRPHNPMVNAGAIAVASLLGGGDPSTRLGRALEMFSRYAGRELFVDVPVFVSERVTGHRNRAIAHLMLNFGMLQGNVEETLDLYFQLCAVRASCSDLALMGATLANGGQNPRTGVQALDPSYLRDLLTVMFTTGLYDYAGQWAYEVGMPAKSGVSGGLVAVAPGRLAVAVFSPPLDSHGNSLRALRVCAELSERLGLHVFGGASQAPRRAKGSSEAAPGGAARGAAKSGKSGKSARASRKGSRPR